MGWVELRKAADKVVGFPLTVQAVKNREQPDMILGCMAGEVFPYIALAILYIDSGTIASKTFLATMAFGFKIFLERRFDSVR